MSRCPSLCAVVMLLCLACAESIPIDRPPAPRTDAGSRPPPPPPPPPGDAGPPAIVPDGGFDAGPPPPVTSDVNLHQAFWRGDQGYTRTVPIIGGVLRWTDAQPWQGPLSAADLPGNGEINCQDAFVLGATLHQGFWRNGKGYYRTVPIVGARVIWSEAGPWGGPMLLDALPGSGDIRSQDGFVLGGVLHQGFWRGDEGYTRTVPTVGDDVIWGEASAWSGPIQLAGLPGRGPIESQNGFILGDSLQQGFWRGGEGYTRRVPIRGDAVIWSEAGAWAGPLSVDILPGTGEVRSQSGYILQ